MYEQQGAVYGDEGVDAFREAEASAKYVIVQTLIKGWLVNLVTLSSVGASRKEYGRMGNWKKPRLNTRRE